MRLLAEIGDVVPLIIGIIALISWVANKIKESSNANAGGVVADAPGEEADGDVRVQAEIDRFLQQVRGGGQSPAPAPEVTPTAPATATVQKKTQRLTERHVIGDRHIRSGVGDVDGDSDERMSRRVDRDLGHGVEQSVASHLGPSVGDSRGADVSFDSSDWTAENLVGLLTRPDGMRQAVLVHEILSRPKGRRGRSGP
ncbi:MAG: hypothetical protein CMJ69_02130 [Planctomycetaceae bacterium]|nr:hypothetical protein [Planctomycetaceae bacterium]|tara:strand:- start:536 stop:1129 length:594 start_codon:yes stop_codon:yes gene_type:complete